MHMNNMMLNPTSVHLGMVCDLMFPILIFFCLHQSNLLKNTTHLHSHIQTLNINLKKKTYTEFEISVS